LASADQSGWSARRLLEPSFGAGSFLLAAIDRVTAAWRRFESAPMGKLVRAMLAGGPKSDPRVEEGAVTASDPWLLDEADQLRVLRDGGSRRSVGSSPHSSPSWSLSALQLADPEHRVRLRIERVIACYRPLRSPKEFACRA
jgi:hypothetical protein